MWGNIILHIKHYDEILVTSEIVAIDISELNKLKVIWHLIRDLSDLRGGSWHVVNESIFTWRNGSCAAIDYYVAKSGNSVGTFQSSSGGILSG